MSEVASDEKVGRPTYMKKQVAHYFRDLGISDWNRSQGRDLDKAYLEKLAENIKQNGLLCPIILVRDKKSGRLRVLAGAHRLAALRLLRGDDGGLYESEFIILEIDESDERCFEISVADNRYQRKSPLFETMIYIQRIVEERQITQEKAAMELGIDRQVANRLLIYAKHIDSSPESVKADLRRTPDSDREDGGPALTVYGIYEFVPALSKAGMTPAIAAMLERAVSERWPTRKIRRAVKRYMENSDRADGGTVSQDAPRMLKPSDILKQAIKSVSKAEELMAKYGVLGDVTKFLADAKELLAARLAELKPAKKDGKPARGRKVKSSKKDQVITTQADAAKVPEQTVQSTAEPAKPKRGRPRKAPAAATPPTAAAKQMEVVQTT